MEGETFRDREQFHDLFLNLVLSSKVMFRMGTTI